MMSLWNLFKRAVKKSEFEIQRPNEVLNVGIFNEQMKSIAQVPFLIGVSTIDKNDYFDSTLENEGVKGKIFVPETKDFYIGEVL
jgi:hypothetical protein